MHVDRPCAELLEHLRELSARGGEVHPRSTPTLRLPQAPERIGVPRHRGFRIDLPDSQTERMEHELDDCGAHVMAACREHLTERLEEGGRRRMHDEGRRGRSGQDSREVLHMVVDDRGKRGRVKGG